MVIKLFLMMTAAFLIQLTSSKVLFFEEFSDKRFKLRWFNSIENLDKQGNFELGYGAMSVNQNDGLGLKTEDDYRYYLLSRKMKRKYSNKNKTLVIQYQVIFPALMECGGAYIKILGFDFEPTTFNSKTPYKIMFGPDVCGFAFENRELKVILTYKRKYYKINQIIRFHMSHVPQLFTLIIRPDNTYEVHINMSVVAKGHIGKDFRMIKPKRIRDRKANPPSNWDTNEFIMNMQIKPPPNIAQSLMIINPEYYINVTKYHVSEGLPLIYNSNYMRPWHPPFIRNHNYKGKWIPPLIENPNYNINDDFYLQTDLGGVGIDVWQMSSGVIYDNILITDNEKFARKFAKDRWLNVIDLMSDAERKTRPYNGSIEQDTSMYDNQNDEHHEHIDETGKLSCYNNHEAMKNTVIGPSQKQINKMMQERKIKMKTIKREMYSQLSTIPKHSFFDPIFFGGSSKHLKVFNLMERLRIIDQRKFTDSVRFINENNLNNL